ncbi:MAG: 5'-3' exonuclease H3TH domain-containing protein [Acidimicrobiia bacterium]|nr:5'-3' exonuclease H3TH domain-containing protein [Acidimicrobiia bacterium]
MKLHLMDGTYELFRNHFGSPTRTDPSGREVGGVYGIITSTLALLNEPGVTHLAAAFDTVIESFRNEVYPEYKSGEGIAEELLEQFPLAERAMDALGVTVWSMVEFEADDALATAAWRWVPEVDQVVVLTPDKDLAQCYGNPKIVGYDRRKRSFIDSAAVQEKFGILPVSIPDYLALVGDSADGLPGLSGWGAKSTATVLDRYVHLENIPLDDARWEVSVRSSTKLADTLRERMGDALLFRFLAQLRPDVPLVEDLADLEWKGVRREPFLELCDELGFSGLENRPHRWLD